MANERATNGNPSVSGMLISAQRAASRRSVLRAIEAELTKARMDAEKAEYPVLAYFVDIAIAEIKNGAQSDQQEFFQH